MPIADEKMQWKITVPRDAVSWADRQATLHSASKTLIGLAGLVALRFLSAAELEHAIKWARLLDMRRVPWQTVERVADRSMEERDREYHRLLNEMAGYKKAPPSGASVRS